MTNQELLIKYSKFLLARGQSKNYFNVMKLFLAYLDENKIETVTQDVLTNFFIQHSEYSKSSRNQFLKAGRNYFSEFLQIPKDQNEFFKMKLLKVERKIPNYLTEEDIEEAKKCLVTYYSKYMTPIKIRTIIDFLFFSGCRKEEVLTLKRENINLTEKTAKLYGKGDKERQIYFPDKVKKELEQYFRSEAEELNAFSLTIGKLQSMLRVLNKFSDKHIYCHLFRHSFARNINYNKGVDIHMVSKLLGHTSINTTLIYLSPDEKALRDNYRKLVG